ncbi:Lhr-like helicase [Paraburkholderia sp. WC7.3d]
MCTSSLDLGVDFLPVERVFQIGSPKGVARLIQRAGRSGHAPGLPSRVTIVPTHALELIEAAAARDAVDKRQIESRDTPQKPLDVLVQHLVTVAIGGGFDARELHDETLQTYAYRDLTQQEFDWALGFVEGGGATLRAYPDYHRVARDSDGLYRVPRNDLARRHRNNIGTIVANGTLNVAYLSGGRIGAIEESFISRLKPGEVFTFGGRALELIRVQDMTAWVRRARSSRGAMPQWAGSRMPLSSKLADAPFDWDAQLQNGLLSPEELDHDILASLNSSELSLRRFREIARVSGLVFLAHLGSRNARGNCRRRAGFSTRSFVSTIAAIFCSVRPIPKYCCRNSTYGAFVLRSNE